MQVTKNLVTTSVESLNRLDISSLTLQTIHDMIFNPPTIYEIIIFNTEITLKVFVDKI